ncbi:Gfo/Idh/MocA family oxidoreductase [Saccharopolyspora sp. NPDC049426]|uniref:Gfo/Idh/MocA family protein n=1 Tax=Saccharopolyspora sp. NPDC049426 TaxID=3155652 RepID=UPI00343F5B1A
MIGLGHQACTDHLPAVTASDHAELVAICDTDPVALASVGREYTVPSYRDAAAMFAEQNLDFVVVAVPHHAGAPIIRTAAEHGVHVLKEKPLATSLPEARALAACCAEAGIEVMVTMQRRFNPIYAAFDDLAERIGRLYHLQATYTLSVDPAEGWRGHTRLAGGGCLLDMGYHVVDMLLWYFGMPSQVLAHCSATARPEYDYDAEDTATLTLGYNSGMVGTVLLSRCMAPKTEILRVTGTDGAVQLERGQIRRLDRTGTVVESLTREQSWPTAAVAQVNHFCRVLAGTRANTAGPESHLAHAALIHAAYTSAAEGRFIDPRKVME